MSALQPWIVCDRVREQVSLRLDSELSQLEQRMLESHLSRCAACRAFAADVERFTLEVRTAPPERLERPVEVRRPRRFTAARLNVAAGAALALAALGLGTQLAGVEPNSATFGRVQDFSPPYSVLEREQSMIESVRPGRPVPPRGSVL